MKTTAKCLAIVASLMLVVTSEARTNTIATDQELIASLNSVGDGQRELPQAAIIVIEQLDSTTNGSLIVALCRKIDLIDPRFDPSLGSLKPVEFSYPVVGALVRIGTNAVASIDLSLNTETNNLKRRLLHTSRDRIR